ncbi:MAG: serine hydroxymethyltransferase [Alphaproteobacteria bacterium]|nr:serine hydroxymethyltransferase [Alphaproteobacteria bacterium]
MTQPDGDIIIEIVSVGNSVKVSAIDSATQTEVSVIGPANYDQESLTQAALRKLRYVLEKQ